VGEGGVLRSEWGTMCLPILRRRID
jgi:hypothetical protein